MYHQTRNKIGFMVESLEPSELITQITIKSLEVNDLDVILFFEKLGRAATFHLCSNMHVMEAYSFDAPLIATNLNTASKLIGFPTPKPKFFFLNDLEWLRFPQKNYDSFETIYRNRELTLIARSDDHAKLMENCWNVKIDYILNNYDFFGQNFISYLKGKNDSVKRYKNEPVLYKQILDYV